MAEKVNATILSSLSLAKEDCYKKIAVLDEELKFEKEEIEDKVRKIELEKKEHEIKMQILTFECKF